MQRWYLLIALGLVLFIAIVFGGVLPIWQSQQDGHLDQVPAASRENAFIHMLLPNINQANLHVLEQRQRIIDDVSYWQHHHHLSEVERRWLDVVAKEYHVKPFNFRHQPHIDKLLLRVDEIPASLVLAQAINESAWGRSRFAREGNNLFGQWCYTSGCGIVPLRRPVGASYEVQKFATVHDAVAAYFNNINSNQVYQKLWQTRAALRRGGKPLSGDALAVGLVNYSQRGAQYVNILQDIIKRYHLAQYDSA